MTFSVDISNDLQVLDNLEAVTLRATGWVDIKIPTALNEPVDWKEAEPAGGNVLQGDQLWVFPIIFCPRQPPLGARVIDRAGNAWTILDVTYKDQVGVWEVHARNLAVVYGLDTLVKVLVATYTKSTGGEAVATWSVYAASVAARVQPVTQEAQIFEDAEWTKSEFRIILSAEVDNPATPIEPAASNYRIEDSLGRRFRVMGYERPERIDALPVAHCVLVIEGEEGFASRSSSSSSSSSSGR